MIIYKDNTLTFQIETPALVAGRTFRNNVDGTSIQVDAQPMSKERALKKYGVEMKADGFIVFADPNVQLERNDLVKINGTMHKVEYVRFWDDHTQILVSQTREG